MKRALAFIAHFAVCLKLYLLLSHAHPHAIIFAVASLHTLKLNVSLHKMWSTPHGAVCGMFAAPWARLIIEGL